METKTNTILSYSTPTPNPNPNVTPRARFDQKIKTLRGNDLTLTDFMSFFHKLIKINYQETLETIFK